MPFSFRPVQRRGAPVNRSIFAFGVRACPNPLIQQPGFKVLALGGVDFDGVGRSPVGPVALSMGGVASHTVQVEASTARPGKPTPLWKTLRVSHRALPGGYRCFEAEGFR